MLLIVGSYTEALSPALKAEGKGLSLYEFSAEQATLNLLQTVSLRNPSYPVWNAGRKIVMVAEEIMKEENPCLVYFSLNNKQFTLVKTNHLPASFACHLVVVGNNTLVTANYLSSNVCIFNLNNSKEEEATTLFHEGKGIDIRRQEAAHPHMILPYDDRSFFVADIGLDVLVFYEQDALTQQWSRNLKGTIHLPPGTGPRHLICLKNKKYLVVAGELRGEVFLFKLINKQYRQIHFLKLSKTDLTGTAAITADINEKYMYVSERDSNTIFQLGIINDKLVITNSVPCNGLTPRDISIDPSGNWLLAANQDSNSIAVFSIDPLTGHLQFVHTYAIATPNCLCWQA